MAEYQAERSQDEGKRSQQTKLTVPSTDETDRNRHVASVLKGRARSRATFGSALLVAALLGNSALCQKAYFADGYHGGIYGHFPPTFTQFMVEALQRNPDWKINLEIEPETWDFAQTNSPEAYEALKSLVSQGRIEFVNPAYAQSYLWNISGESIIQQFHYGIRKVREHFPQAQFRVYASEEPCFTSALPGVLKSYGFEYAVLKNPNTCWGGYVRPFGGELIDWVGPDGAQIVTVPRYEVETLSSANTFETIASRNSSRYVNAAFEQGIVHPVGMCLQDAGWRFGPWLRDGGATYQPTEYVTWRDYFEKIATRSTGQECRLSQEDIQVSLVWGAQVLQKIARQVRSAENRIVMAEKMAALAGIYRDASWPQRDLDEAWRVLLLAQHHDCWIVPYNGRAGSTWADKVVAWTTRTRQTSEQIIQQAMAALNPTPETNGPTYLRVFNTLGSSRHDLASFSLSAELRGTAVELLDGQGREVASQISSQTDSGSKEILFLANVPPLGFETYRVEKRVPSPIKGASVSTGPDGCCNIESDLYSIVLDPAKGGTIRSFVAKKLGHRELVDRLADRRFGEIRGWFYAENKFKSNAENPATITPLESGPLRVRLKISGRIGSNPVTQILTVVQGQRRIDFSLQIDWQENPRIGADFEQVSGYRAEHDQKAFYDDRFKLLALFPLKLAHKRVLKDAPFDVTESRLTNTFFNCWSGIKNNVMLNWVDAEDTSKHCGVALLTDHTTSYAHGADFPLGLVLQYAGVGLWGRNYGVNGPTEVNYALVPHAGNWEQSGLEEERAKWNEPIMSAGFQTSQTPTKPNRSLLTMDSPGWEIPALMMDHGNILVRLFNTSTDPVPRQISYEGHAAKIELVQLDGKVLKELARHETCQGRTTVDFALPGLGIATLKISP